MIAVPHYQVAIVGAGFCGTMVAVHLARAMPSLSLALIERNSVAGLGLAYGTEDPDHLLNVRAGYMGAFADDPEHFWRWLQASSEVRSVQDCSAQSFVPRMIFGRYLRSILSEAQTTDRTLDVITQRITQISRSPTGEFELMGDDGKLITADRVVLALGNFPPDQLSGSASLMNPYASETWRALADDGDVLIVGTGLTSLDLVITLAKTKHKGTLHLLSRHGLLPREHTDPVTYALKLLPPYPRNALGLLQALRREIAENPLVPWQSILDALRPLNQQLWQSLNSHEQRRFLRHLRAYWDVHRHRCAPKVMDAYRALERAGRLILHHGSIVSQTRHEKDWDVVWRPRGQASAKNLTVQHIVRCTGPQADIGRLDDGLVQNLLEGGLVTPDCLRLGIASAEDYTASDNKGSKVEGLYLLGSLLKGKLYESVAVPELRKQAADVAHLIVRALKDKKDLLF